MLKASHTTLIVISGLVWFVVGCFLLPLGLNFVVESILRENAHQNKPLLDIINSFVGSLDTSALIILFTALALGYVKGRFVFGKTVQKGVKRIISLPNPAPFSKIYTLKYYILLGSMVFIGFLVKYASLDIRGFIDVTIGSALIQGAILYFRSAVSVYKKEQKFV